MRADLRSCAVPLAPRPAFWSSLGMFRSGEMQPQSWDAASSCGDPHCLPSPTKRAPPQVSRVRRGHTGPPAENPASHCPTRKGVKEPQELWGLGTQQQGWPDILLARKEAPMTPSSPPRLETMWSQVEETDERSHPRQSSS